jgi:hypothetical protein
MKHGAAMVMRKICVKMPGDRNRGAPGLSHSTVDQHVGWLAAGCSRLDTISKNAMPKDPNGPRRPQRPLLAQRLIDHQVTM